MTSPLRYALAALAALALLLLPACEDAVTRDNFDRIAVGMDMTEVEDILGGSGELQQAGGVGIGASGLLEGQSGADDVKSYLWGDETTGIIVKFKDGKVVYKEPRGL